MNMQVLILYNFKNHNKRQSLNSFTSFSEEQEAEGQPRFPDAQDL